MVDFPEPPALDVLEKRYATVDPWQKVGFSRTLGGFFYRYALFLIELVIGASLIGFLFNLFYPWPEGEGYRNVAGSLFVVLFSVFDIGTAYGIERFIAEWRVKNPRKMLKYLQFFIWYQMMTGLLQITGISAWALFIAPQTSLAHLMFLFLIISSTQYPGMLGFFSGALKGLQRFDKSQILMFLHGQFLQMATNILFILIGRFLGAQNPAVGELMGLAIGAAIGSYIDDVFAMFLGAHFFKKAVRDIFPDLRIRDCFRPDFDWAIAKECMWFGAQISAGGLFGVVTSQIITFYWIFFVPQFSTWIMLSNVAAGLAQAVQWGTGLDLVPAISESFLNDKKKLAQFYIAQSWRWNFFMAVPLIIMLIIYLPMILTVALSIGDASVYLLAVPFFGPWIIAKLLEPISSFADQVIVGASRPRFITIARVIEEIGKLAIMTLWIPVLRVTDGGLPVLIWIMPLGTFIPTAIKTYASWYYIHNRIVHVRIPWWQALVAPVLSSVAILLISMAYITFVWPPLVATLTLIPAAVITLLWMLFGTLAIYFFFYTFFGGFDSFGLEILNQAVSMSGPSKPLMKIILALIAVGIKISPLHNKFPIPAQDAYKEALELMYIREINEAREEKK